MSLTGHVMSLTDHVMSLTGHVMSLTDHVMSLTDHVMSLTGQVMSLTGHDMSLTGHDMSLTGHVPRQHVLSHSHCNVFPIPKSTQDMHPVKCSLKNKQIMSMYTAEPPIICEKHLTCTTVVVLNIHVFVHKMFLGCVKHLKKDHDLIVN